MYKLFIPLILTGCFGSKHKVEFNPTNSMCLDSTVVNMQAAGCNAVLVEKTTYGITKLYCHDTKKNAEDSSWLTNEFYAIAFGSSIPVDVKPICTDPFLIMTTAEKD
tara:strand:- start:1380 stop:1700 length:321 start_codon:yes stop_codon:yes gene_type:complete